MKVSVIIPTYNRAVLVVEALKSVLKQTFRDKEIIIVDDGSTDETADRLRPFLDQIRYVHQANKGVNAARNFGLSMAAGEYIALLDGDDLWQPYLLELFVEILERNDEVGFVFSDFSVLNPDGSLSHKMLKSWYTREDNWDNIFESSTKLPDNLLKLLPQAASRDATLYKGNIYHPSLYHAAVLPSASLYRRSMTKEPTSLNESDSICGDWEFFAKLSNEHGAAFLSTDAAINRSHDDAVRLMRTDLSIRLRHQIQLVERVWKSDLDFLTDHRDDVDDVLRSLFATLIKVHLVNGDRLAARAAISELHDFDIRGYGIRLQLMILIARVPGSAFVLDRVRLLRDKLMN